MADQKLEMVVPATWPRVSSDALIGFEALEDACDRLLRSLEREPALLVLLISRRQWIYAANALYCVGEIFHWEEAPLWTLWQRRARLVIDRTLAWELPGSWYLIAQPRSDEVTLEEMQLMEGTR